MKSFLAESAKKKYFENLELPFFILAKLRKKLFSEKSVSCDPCSNGTVSSGSNFLLDILFVILYLFDASATNITVYNLERIENGPYFFSTQKINDPFSEWPASCLIF